MRPFHQFLLILALVVGMIVTVVSWEKLWVAPLVEQAQRKPEVVESYDTELPAACLEELSDFGPEPTATRPSLVQSEPAGESASGHENVLRPRPARLQADRIPTTSEVASRGQAEPDSAPSGSDASAHPIAEGKAMPATVLANHASASEPQEAAKRTIAVPIAVDESTAEDLSREALKRVDLLELMRRLRSEEVDERGQARAELSRRGFGEVDLELARQLFSPEIEARKQLARTVPRLESVDAAKWLMWLVLDPEPEVRMVAVTTLATTGNPALLDRVEAIAHKDSDPRIQGLADQIAKQRDYAASRGGSPAGSMR